MLPVTAVLPLTILDSDTYLEPKGFQVLVLETGLGKLKKGSALGFTFVSMWPRRFWCWVVRSGQAKSGSGSTRFRATP